jgi:hypothetical protein
MSEVKGRGRSPGIGATLVARMADLTIQSKWLLWRT